MTLCNVYLLRIYIITFNKKKKSTPGYKTWNLYLQMWCEKLNEQINNFCILLCVPNKIYSIQLHLSEFLKLRSREINMKPLALLNMLFRKKSTSDGSDWLKGHTDVLHQIQGKNKNFFLDLRYTNWNNY